MAPCFLVKCQLLQYVLTSEISKGETKASALWDISDGHIIDLSSNHRNVKIATNIELLFIIKINKKVNRGYKAFIHGCLYPPNFFLT